MLLIDNQKDFDKLCEELMRHKILYMDTEFDRRKTYYAKLSVIQVAYDANPMIIDVLSGINITAFKAVLANKDIVKVFHSPEQDLGIFLHIFGELPKNVFDTQIAAEVCNISDNIGYGRLCKILLNKEVDKTLQTADWLARPLSPKLLEYASKDIEFLIPIYEILSNIVEKLNFTKAYRRKIEKLLDLNNYKPSIEKLVEKIGYTGTSEKFGYRLKMLMSFREDWAQKINVPRNFCCSDDELLRLCHYLPTTEQDLRKLKLSGKILSNPRSKQGLLDFCAGLREASAREA